MKQSNNTSYLIVNADDFGRSQGVNKGVIRAHEEGIVTSASLMVRWPAAVEAAAYARLHSSLSLGLHLDFCEWGYCDGTWMRAYEVVDLTNKAAVKDEIHRQLAAFRHLTGRAPTHLDSHQHVHRTEPVASLVTALASELEIPLRHFTPHIYYEGSFYGQTSQGFAYAEGITSDTLISIISALPPGFTELGCHPGAHADFDTVYQDERLTELETLCDPQVRESIANRGIVLCGFQEVPCSQELAQELQGSGALERGIKAYQDGEFKQAGFWLRKATVTRGSGADAWLWLARTQLTLKEIQDSFDSICQALTLQPEWPVALAHLELLLADESQKAAYVEHLRQMARTHADQPDMLAWAIRCLLLVKAYAALLDVADKLLQPEPQNEEALCCQAVAMYASGSSLEEVKTLLASRAGSASPLAVRVLGRFYLALNDPLEAWRQVKPFAPITDDQELLITIGQRLWARGHLSAACEIFEKSAAAAPGDQHLQHWWDTASAEVDVLSGRWSPPKLRRKHLTPIAGRVLHLVDKSVPYNQSGYTVRTHYVAQAQRETGLEPHVVTPLGFPDDQGILQAPPVDEVDGIPYYRLSPVNGIPSRLDQRLAANMRQLADLMCQLRPAILHAASDYQNALMALELGRAFGIPVLYEVRGFWEETWLSRQGTGAAQSERYTWWKARELACMAAADRVVTLAEVMKSYMVERGLAPDKIAVIPNAVDCCKFAPVERDPKLAGELRIGRDEVVLGYVSTFWRYEGIHVLIDALAKLTTRYPQVRALLIGDGEEKPRLEAQVAALGLADRVTFTGSVPHAAVQSYYSLIDIFVVARTRDRVSQLVTPLKPMEAMATGRAMVVSDVPALREIIEEGITGLVFRPEDAEHLAATVAPLIEDQDRRQSLGRAARDWVCQGRTWGQNGQRYLEVYQSLQTR